MRLFIAAVVCLFSFRSASAQEQQLPAEVIIIGTIHYGNKTFNHRTLYRLLQQLQPQVLLDEHSKEYKPVFGLQAASFLKIAKVSIEQLAMQKFYRKNKQVVIRPFDTAFASRIRYIKQAAKAEQTFFNLLNVAAMSAEDSLLYEHYANHRNGYHHFLKNASLSAINQPDVIDKARVQYRMEEEVILPIGKKYIADSAVVNAFTDDLFFWQQRNLYMVKQIKSYIRRYPGKRIVVLTGLNHKYFLIDQLRKEETLSFRFMEPYPQ